MDKPKQSPKGTSAKPGEVKKPTQTQHPTAEKKEPQKPGKPTGFKH